MVENVKALSNMPGAKHGAKGAGPAQKSDLQHLLDLGNNLGYVVQAPTGVLSWARRPTAGLWAQ